MKTTNPENAVETYAEMLGMTEDRLIQTLAQGWPTRCSEQAGLK